MELTPIEVGKPFTLFPPSGIANGAILEAVKDGGLMLMVYLSDMTASEEQAIRQGKITVKALKEGQHLLLLLHFAGPDNLIFEIRFDPTLYEDERRNNVGKTNLLHIVGIESNTHTVRCQRLVSIPRTLLGTMNTYWGPSAEVNTPRYERWLNDLYSRYTTDQLWGMATYAGRLGEY